ncbi:UDP-2,4-diacetamido-2,4,6-trideoxy-beta-L-altropyranose hydrolase [Paradesulfitobacterium aromaticivorans]
MRNEIVFLTEGGPGIGLGHVRRCLAIAREMEARNKFNISFLINNPSVSELILKSGFKAFYNKSLFMLPKPNQTIVVMDLKRDVSEEIRIVKAKGAKVCLIDNSTPARILADTVIYPVEHLVDGLDWEGFTGEYFAGAKYFPLNREFIEDGSSARYIDKESFRILITMGGSDPFNLTLTVVRAVLQIPFVKVKAVIGPNFVLKQVEDLMILSKKNPELEILQNVTNMARVMSLSQLAITAFGTTLFELAFMGLPAMILGNYSIDKAEARIYESLGCALFLGYYRELKEIDIIKGVKFLIRDEYKLKKMSIAGKTLVDGLGASRIVDIIQT